MTGLEGWITTREAAVITGYGATHLRNLARTGRVTALRVGRDWLLNRESVLLYQARMNALGPGKHNPWRDDLGAGGRRRAR